MRVQIELNRAYELVHYPEVLFDASPDPTVVILGPDGDDIVAEVAATRSGRQTDITGIVGDMVVTADDPSQVRLGPMMIVSGEQQYEVRVIRIDGNQVQLDSRLRTDDGVLADHSLSVDIPSQTETIRSARANWRGEIRGRYHREDISLDFVRDPFFIGITESDITSVGVLYGALGDNQGSYIEIRNRALADVMDWLYGKGIFPDLVKDRDLLKSAVIYRILHLRYARDPELSRAFSEMHHDSLMNFMASKSWYDANDDGVKEDSVEERPPVIYARIV